MIEKLSNGNTLITLGEGTVFTGNVSDSDEEKPFGIYFSDREGKSDNAVIIALPHNKAVASYMMTLVRFMDAYADEKEDADIAKAIKTLKSELEPLMPKKKLD